MPLLVEVPSIPDKEHVLLFCEVSRKCCYTGTSMANTQNFRSCILRMCKIKKYILTALYMRISARCINAAGMYINKHTTLNKARWRFNSCRPNFVSENRPWVKLWLKQITTTFLRVAWEFIFPWQFSLPTWHFPCTVFPFYFHAPFQIHYCSLIYEEAL